MKEDEHEEPVVPYIQYVWVWLGLVLLTWLTVGVAGLKLGKASILGALGIASIKAGLVLTYFMNLRHESRLFRYMLLVALVTLFTILGLTFTDILFR